MIMPSSLNMSSIKLSSGRGGNMRAQKIIFYTHLASLLVNDDRSVYEIDEADPEEINDSCISLSCYAYLEGYTLHGFIIDDRATEFFGRPEPPAYGKYKALKGNVITYTALYDPIK